MLRILGGQSVRILLLGATGLIGTAVAARLRAVGHEVTGVARRVDGAARRVPVARWVALDLRDIEGPQDWLPHLDCIDAVVNCAGTLQDNGRDSTAHVHAAAPAALWTACEQAGIRRVVQMSAMGVDRPAATEFMRTKQDGDAALEASGLDWVILRPSVVLGRQAYGGSALIRGLAAMPCALAIDEARQIEAVQLDDVAETVARMVEPGAASRVAFDLSGPERLDFADVVARYRAWLGWRPARRLRLPGFVLAAAWRLGDLVAWLGWRPPVRTTARIELAMGSTGDGRMWRQLTGIPPQSLDAALSANPAGVQERWFARLFLLKPVAIVSFALFWLLTGLITLGPGRGEAIRLTEATAAAPWAWELVVGGAMLDVAMGLSLLHRRTVRAALIVAFFGTMGYLVAGTILMPELWADPLGRLLKIAPIMVLNLVCLAILDDR